MTDDSSDPELVEGISGGDREALRALYLRHGPWLLARLSRRCADVGYVEEALQDTFVAVWRRSATYSGRGSVAAWLWSIAIRRLIDRLRKGRDLGPLPAERSEVTVSAEDQVLVGVEYGDLAGALERLSPELRAVLQATAIDGLTTKEAAHLLGIPQGTVKTRLVRARVRLREELA